PLPAPAAPPLLSSPGPLPPVVVVAAPPPPAVAQLAAPYVRPVARALTIRAGKYGLVWALPLLLFLLGWAITATAGRELRSFA
nr:hypothetical protein [Actinomycetota bacterium]